MNFKTKMCKNKYCRVSVFRPGPIIGTVCGKNLCASENNNRTWWDQTPTGQAPISLSQPDPSSRVISQTLSMAGTKKTEGFGKGA